MFHPFLSSPTCLNETQYNHPFKAIYTFSHKQAKENRRPILEIIGIRSYRLILLALSESIYIESSGDALI